MKSSLTIKLSLNHSLLAALKALAFWLCIGSHGWAFGSPEPNSSNAIAPNVIVFLVDDMGVMDTSVPFLTDQDARPVRYPLNFYYRTPNMERLAAQGIRFSQFYAMSVCSPTRISLMTGQNAARHKTTNWIDPDRDNAGPLGPKEWNWRGLQSNSITLARQLQSKGYRTIHIGKGHFGPKGTEGSSPSNLGFDVNIGGSSIGMPSTYYGEKNYGNAGGSITKANTHPVPNLEKYHGTDTFLTEAITREAIAQIDQSRAEAKPFFLYLAHYAVHGPFDSDPRYASNYVGTDKPPLAKAFATLVEGMDKSLGDVMDHLQKIGAAENTLILFVGDNGSDAPLGPPHTVACAAPLRGKKGSHYEGGVRVPFIAAWGKPNRANAIQQRLPIAIGAVQTQIAAVYDLFPTILNLTEIETPKDHVVDGADLATLMQGRIDSSHSVEFLMHYPHAPHRSDYFTMYRRGNWKLIYHYVPTADQSGNARYQLFDLLNDPFEQNDLADSLPAQVSRMTRLMIERLTEQQALYPVDKNGALIEPVLP